MEYRPAEGKTRSYIGIYRNGKINKHAVRLLKMYSKKDDAITCNVYIDTVVMIDRQYA